MFTIGQLARLAGITPRTLRYYDRLGLLKPSQVGDNGYRYYAEDAVLRLQQVLFYRELGVSLGDIRRIMGSPDFDVIRALESHKEQLRERIGRLERLTATVDNTLAYLKGNLQMSDRQLFEALSDEQQSEYEQEAMRQYDPAVVRESSRRWKSYGASEKRRIGEEGNAVYRDMLLAMPKGAASPEAQACVERWRRHMEYFWIPNDEQLLSISQGYVSDPRFRANFDRIDPRLAEFVRDAVRIYVQARRA